MSINIKIENFEGPFDLLLHLIKKNEMDIYNVKLSYITNQYMEYLNSMKELDLEITSEFIVISATLLEIKSKELLPKNEEKETEEVEISKEELLSKLIEYKKFKEVAEFLKEKENKSEGVVYSKKPEIIEDDKSVDLKELLKKTSLISLYELYNKLLLLYYNKKNDNSIPKQISIDKFRIEDKMEHLEMYFQNRSKSTFSQIIYNCESKIEVIVTFLAMLELIRLKKVKVLQEHNFTEIYIERR